jgi:hypothetical protein
MTPSQAAAMIKSYTVPVLDLLLIILVLLTTIARFTPRLNFVPVPSVTDLAYLAGARWLATR